MEAQGFQMIGSGVSLVAGKAVLRIDCVPFFHAGIAMSFGKNGGSGDGNAARVAFDEGLLLDENIELHGVDQQIIWLDRELLQRRRHGLAAGLINVPGIDALRIDFGNSPGKSMLANARGKFGTALRLKFFRIVEADDSAFGIEDDRGGDNRAKERAAPGLIETGDAHPAELPRRTLETGRAEAAHRAEILARCAYLERLLISQRDDGIHLHGPAGRNIACHERYKHQHKSHAGKCDRIRRLDSVQELRHQA